MKVSIITGTYNSERHIADCIKSVNSQDYQNIEHIIIDGASKDNTVETIKSTPNRVKKIVSEPDDGIYNAMNKGLMLADGEILGILNSDDFYNHDEVISMVVEEFVKKEVDCVYGDLFYVDQENPEIVKRKWVTGPYSPKKGFKHGWHPAHPSFFVKKEVYKKYGYFDESFGLAADFELMLRFLEKHKIRGAYIEFPMVRMRLGGATNKSFKNIMKGNKECLEAFRKNGLEVPATYTLKRLTDKILQYFG